jgi:hypothetical protein
MSGTTCRRPREVLPSARFHLAGAPLRARADVAHGRTPLLHHGRHAPLAQRTAPLPYLCVLRWHPAQRPTRSPGQVSADGSGSVIGGTGVVIMDPVLGDDFRSPHHRISARWHCCSIRAQVTNVGGLGARPPTVVDGGQVRVRQAPRGRLGKPDAGCLGCERARRIVAVPGADSVAEAGSAPAGRLGRSPVQDGGVEARRQSRMRSWASGLQCVPARMPEVRSRRVSSCGTGRRRLPAAWQPPACTSMGGRSPLYFPSFSLSWALFMDERPSMLRRLASSYSWS